jgi:hypothetical protein
MRQALAYWADLSTREPAQARLLAPAQLSITFHDLITLMPCVGRAAAIRKSESARMLQGGRSNLAQGA